MFWLRTQLRNTRAEPVTYWLVLDNPRLEDVQLSQRAMGDMGPGITRVAGWRYPQFWREVSADMVVFPITVPGGGMEELMLRVESRSAVSLGTVCGNRWPFASRNQPAPVARPDDGHAGRGGGVRADSGGGAPGYRVHPVCPVAGQLHVPCLVFLGYGYRYFGPQGGGEVVRLTGVMGASSALMFMLLSMSFCTFARPCRPGCIAKPGCWPGCWWR